jgi:hypothetical protein
VFAALAAALAAAYLAATAALFVQQRAMLYPGAASGPAAAAVATAAAPAGFRDVVLATEDGERLAAWWKPPEPGRAVVLYFFGNGGNLPGRARRARMLAEGGRGVLIVSYRGYPGSTGSPTEAGLGLDARAAYDWAAARLGAAARGIVLYGESLGSGVAVRLATERPAAGVVLDAPFTSAADVARLGFPFVPVGLLMLDQFRSAERIARIGAPLLVLHGERDAVVPIALGERLFAAAAEPKRFVRLPGAGHSEALERGGIAAVRAFLEEVEGRP